MYARILSGLAASSAVVLLTGGTLAGSAGAVDPSDTLPLPASTSSSAPSASVAPSESGVPSAPSDPSQAEQSGVLSIRGLDDTQLTDVSGIHVRVHFPDGTYEEVVTPQDLPLPPGNYQLEVDYVPAGYQLRSPADMITTVLSGQTESAYVEVKNISAPTTSQHSSTIPGESPHGRVPIRSIPSGRTS
ncbi:MAG: hypothetical protein QM774_04480 [Gordonia sp. (in: high G+C Gram-positive bacteria)]|uniref:hypothetical protein n=1 Tax=Gordonia sp. (in: high G+C Gram-positive bacteria) TaxID=84139 RepID=UPI0039E2C50E